MKLADLLAPELAVVALDATTVAQAAHALAERIIASGAVADPELFRRRIAEERGEDTVPMGDRANVLHYRTEAVTDLVVGIATTRAPMHRDPEGEDGGTRILLMLLAPRQLAARYLQVLGAFARALGGPSVVDAVVSAATPEALVALPLWREVELPEQLAVRDIMSVRPRTTSPDAPLRDAAQVIARAAITALPVVEKDGLLVGMLSERELIRYLLSAYLQGSAGKQAGSASARRAVRDVMTRQVLCVSSEQPLAEVASIMVNKDVDGVPVVHEGRVVGFLSRGDIIRKLLGY